MPPACCSGLYPVHTDYSVLGRSGDQEPDLRLHVLEGALFRLDRCSRFRVISFASALNIYRSAETLIDKAIELQSIGGVYGNQKPTEFICLLLKLLQIQPEKEILIEYLRADEFKLGMPSPGSAWVDTDTKPRYLRALAAMYIRMTFRAAEVYDLLDPLLKDFRKLRIRSMGTSLSHPEEPGSDGLDSGLYTDVHGRVCG